MTAEKIMQIFEEWAPATLAEEWDNVGLLIGDVSRTINKVLVALDATEAVIDEAVKGGFDFLVVHHPLVYNPVKRITTADSVGKKILALVENKIGCFCAHTNLDKASGGVSDLLAQKIGLHDIAPLIPESHEVQGLEHNAQDALLLPPVEIAERFSSTSQIGIGRVGFLLEEKSLTALAADIKAALQLSTVRISGDGDKKIKKIGLCGGDGSGSRYMEAAIAAKCDLYITGDLRYHAVQEALERGIAFVDITHYGGEVLVIDAIVSRLRDAVPGLKIFPSSIDAQVFASL